MVTTPADRLATSGSLFAVLFEYRVQKWGGVIEAHGSTRVANSTLVIDLEKEVVIRTESETADAGAKTSDRSIQTWRLR